MLRITPEQAATTIQKNVRGFLARRKYGIKHLSKDQQDSYPAFVVGNDPVMPASLDKYNEPTKKIALIGTSGMRVVSIACKLGNPKNIPKIILIDNSKEVYEFWYAMREFVKDDIKAATEQLFLKNLPSFLGSHIHLYRDLPDDCYASEAPPGVKYLNQNVHTYFIALIKKYGYDYVRSVICHTSLIKQSWADSSVFVKVKNILSYLGIDKIYMYPSNIAACIDNAQIRTQVLENISKTNPILSIHTDCCSVHGFPEKVYLLENNNPAYVSNTIFSPSTCKPKHNHVDLNEFIFLLRMLQNSLNTEQDIDVKFLSEKIIKKF